MTRAEQFRRFHRTPPLLVLLNAWDVASAKTFAALPGCRAIATTSAAVARSLGWEDGEQAPVEEMLKVVERIVRAVDVPVTADLEAGYGDPPRTAAAAVAIGAAGINLEDSHGEAEMVPIDEQIEIIRATRAAAPDAGAQRARRRLHHPHGRDRGGDRARQRLPGRRRRLHLSDPRAVRDARPARGGDRPARSTCSPGPRTRGSRSSRSSASHGSPSGPRLPLRRSPRPPGSPPPRCSQPEAEQPLNSHLRPFLRAAINKQ